MSLSRPVSRRKLSSAATASISVSLPRGASRSNQARKRTTAAPSRTCAARAPEISASFFTAFISAIGSAPRAALPPCGRDHACQRVGGGGLVEPHRFLLPAERAQRRHEIGRLAHIGERFETVAHVVRKLAAIHEEGWAARLRNDGEGERQRRVRHVGAADVERPGDRMRIGDDERVGAQLARLRVRMRASLASAASPAKRRSCSVTAPERRRRAIAPDRVDQVGLDRDQRGAGSGAGLAQSLRVFDRVQPGIVADAVAAAEIVLDPAVGRRLDEMLDGKQRGIDLLARLQRVAAVDEQDRALHEDDRGAGGAGEAGEPGQPLLASRQDIRSGGDRCAARSGRSEPRRANSVRSAASREPACGAFGSVLERLEACLEHDGNLWGGRCSGNARARSKNSGLAIGAQAWTSWR